MSVNLHRLAAGLGLKDQDARRDFFERETGKRSQSQMSRADIDKVGAALRREYGSENRKTRKDGPLVSKMVMIWLNLCDAGVVCAGATELQEKLDALNSFVNSNKWALKWGATVTHYRFLENNPRRANDIIEALKDIARRKQVAEVW